MSGCFFSVLLQKTKIKTQNDVIDHQSASQSGYEDVRISFKQSKQFFKALKCRKCEIKIKFNNAHSRAVNVRTNRPLDRTFSSQVFKRFKRFKSKGSQSAILSVYFKQSNQCSNALKCQKWAIKKIDMKILMLTPGPLDRTFSRAARSNVFKSSFPSQKAVVVVIGARMH